MAQSWLDDFVAWSGYGESPEKYLYWTGVATIAGALRRKVWIQEKGYQWTPNFYILLVGPPGGPKKTTSINFGLQLLRRIDGIDFGPDNMTWQQLITHMADARQTFVVDGANFEASCVTISVDEFGTFFDPSDRLLVDSMTGLWDSKLGVYKKETKTMGCDEIVNPWLNVIAGTTPGWLSDNFNSKLLRSGFASRPVFLYADKAPRDVAYPSLQVPDCAAQSAMEASLMERLNEYSTYAGRFALTDDAYKWGASWYVDYKAQQAAMHDGREAAFYERRQTHLHKLAMVISVSRGDFPAITAAHLAEADIKLHEIDPDIKTIFGFVGQTRMSQAASELLEVLRKVKQVRKIELFRRYFFRTMDEKEFEVAINSVRAAGYVKMTGPLDDPVVCLNKEVI